MKDIQAFSDSELLEKTRQVVAEERRITARVLAHLEEVEEGRLSLTNLVKARSHFRKSPMAVEQKRELLRELEGLTTRECERRLEPEAPRRKTFEVDDELLADLQRIRELWGNQDLSDTELLRKMAKLVLARIDPEAKKSPGAPKVQEPDAPPAELVTPETRYIPAAVKREVWIRDGGRCTWPGCASRYALQFDHVVPYSHGGAHAAANLRLLCRVHHRARSTGPGPYSPITTPRPASRPWASGSEKRAPRTLLATGSIR